MNPTFDLVIIGSGVGGGAVLHTLADTGLNILLIERGGYVKQEPANWDVTEVTVNRRYDAGDTWYDGQGRPFTPRVYYNVGGSTKFYGASAIRFRESDFATWPYPYAELAPWYDRAEALLQVHGQAGEDPTEPPRGPYPYAPLDHEPVIGALAERLARQGLHPLHLPIAVDQGPKGKCVKGSPCDGFPCQYRAKGDAENRLIRPILLRKPANVTLWTHALVHRLETDATGTRVVSAVVEKEGQRILVSAPTFVVAAGAVNSAALLLKSANARHPRGLANGSDQLGRNFMSHNNSVILALSPWRLNPTKFQKTLAIHEFYAEGTLQCRGKVKPEMLASKNDFWLRTFRKAVTDRSVDFWLMSEDLPVPESRVTVDAESRIHLDRKASNVELHHRWVRHAQQFLGDAGLPVQFVDDRGIAAIQHQCGTVKFGSDPRTSVLDPFCKAHEVDNLWVIDAGFFATSGAVNPVLTLLAQALRASERLKAVLKP